MSDTVQPSVIVLRTGEKLITLLQEAFEGEGEDRKGVCLVMGYPYELKLQEVEPLETDPSQDLQVKFTKWCPYAVENSYRIPYDCVLTLGTPDPGLADAYMQKVNFQREVEERARVAAEAQDNPEGGSLDQQKRDIAAALGGASVPDGIGVGGDTQPEPETAPVEVV